MFYTINKDEDNRMQLVNAGYIVVIVMLPF